MNNIDLNGAAINVRLTELETKMKELEEGFGLLCQTTLKLQHAIAVLVGAKAPEKIDPESTQPKIEIIRG